MSLMHTTALAQLLGTLSSAPASDCHLWRDAAGRMQGQSLRYAPTSLFGPVWQLVADGVLIPAGHEVLIHTWTRDGDPGPNPWKVLSPVSDNSTLVESDRPCRLVYTLNYFSYIDARRLIVNAHGRLLAAVAAGHGKAFHRTVTVLGLHPKQLVIQMPSTINDDPGLLLFVVDDYRRNGFVMAAQVSDPVEASTLFMHARPTCLKLDARCDWCTRNVMLLIDLACELGATLVLRRYEHPSNLELVRAAGITYVQGNILPGAESGPEPASTSQVVPIVQAPLVQQQQSAVGLFLTQ